MCRYSYKLPLPFILILNLPLATKSKRRLFSTAAVATFITFTALIATATIIDLHQASCLNGQGQTKSDGEGEEEAREDEGCAGADESQEGAC